MIYVDSSVLLADLFVEPRSPPPSLWEDDLVSSELLAYEVWNTINARNLIVSHGARAQGLLARVTLTEMNQTALARALTPFPVQVRTLDSLHLATLVFLRDRDESIELSTYDNRLRAAAEALGIPLAEL